MLEPPVSQHHNYPNNFGSKVGKLVDVLYYLLLSLGYGRRTPFRIRLGGGARVKLLYYSIAKHVASKHCFVGKFVLQGSKPKSEDQMGSS